MLQTYQARVNGTQLIWIDPPAQPLEHAHVLIVVEQAKSVRTREKPSAREVFFQAEGVLAKSSSDAVERQLNDLRSEWDRPIDPLNFNQK